MFAVNITSITRTTCVQSAVNMPVDAKVVSILMSVILQLMVLQCRTAMPHQHLLNNLLRPLLLTTQGLVLGNVPGKMTLPNLSMPGITYQTVEYHHLDHPTARVPLALTVVGF